MNELKSLMNLGGVNGSNMERKRQLRKVPRENNTSKVLCIISTLYNKGENGKNGQEQKGFKATDHSCKLTLSWEHVFSFGNYCCYLERTALEYTYEGAPFVQLVYLL